MNEYELQWLSGTQISDWRKMQLTEGTYGIIINPVPTTRTVVVVVSIEKSNRKLANFCLLVRYAVKSNG
eukprot:scaffold4912_cov284-Chaetoceros_neogracile.AAC.10